MTKPTILAFVAAILLTFFPFCSNGEVILKVNGKYICEPMGSSKSRALFVADNPTTGSPLVVRAHKFYDPNIVDEKTKKKFHGSYMFFTVHEKGRNKYWQANGNSRDHEIRTNDLPGGKEGFTIHPAPKKLQFRIRSVHYDKYVGINKKNRLALVGKRDAGMFSYSVSRPKDVLNADEAIRVAANSRERAVRDLKSSTADLNKKTSLLSRKITVLDTNTPVLIQFNPYVRSYYIRCDLGNGYKLDYSSEKERNPDTAPEYNPVEESAASTGNQAKQTNDYVTTRKGEYEESATKDAYIYFSSQRFTDWCCPETFGAYAYSLYASEGEASDEIAAKIREMVLLEYYDIISWLEGIGEEESEKATKAILARILNTLPAPEFGTLNANSSLSGTVNGANSSLSRASQAKPVSITVDKLGTLEFETGLVDYRYEFEPRQVNAAILPYVQLEKQLFNTEKLRARWEKAKGDTSDYLGDRAKFGHHYFSIRLKLKKPPTESSLLKRRVNLLNDASHDSLMSRFKAELADAIKEITNPTVRDFFELAEKHIEKRNAAIKVNVSRISGIENEFEKEKLAAEIGNAEYDRGIISLLESSQLRKDIQKFASEKLCLGEDGSATVKVMEMDIYSGAMRLELNLNHRQSWGTADKFLKGTKDSLSEAVGRAKGLLGEKAELLYDGLLDSHHRAIVSAKQDLEELSRLKSRVQQARKHSEQLAQSIANAKSHAASIRRKSKALQGKLDNQYKDAVTRLGRGKPVLDIPSWEKLQGERERNMKKLGDRAKEEAGKAINRADEVVNSVPKF